VVNATLSLGSHMMTATAFLKPDENILVVEVTATVALEQLAVHSSVLALSNLSHAGHSEEMDGRIGSGVSGGGRVVYSQRQPLGLSSPKPISVAVATSFGGSASLTCAPAAPPPPPPPPLGHSSSEHTSPNYDGGVGCTTKLSRGQTLTVSSVVLSNWDLCSTPAGCADPLPAALERAAGLHNITTTAAASAAEAGAVSESSVGAIAAANAAWWGAFWNDTWVALPDDPSLESFYYGTTYMIASASRKGKMAAGLYV
jgi:hypothetical protein